MTILLQIALLLSLIAMADTTCARGMASCTA
jgi:hypothetical protein